MDESSILASNCKFLQIGYALEGGCSKKGEIRLNFVKGQIQCQTQSKRCNPRAFRILVEIRDGRAIIDHPLKVKSLLLKRGV